MERYIAPGACGRLLLYRGGRSLEVPAEVAYVDEEDVAFAYRSENSEELAHILAHLEL